MAVESWRTDNPCTGTESYLHESNWLKHVTKRPEIGECLDSARETAADPDFAVRDEHGVIFKYRMGYGSGKTAGCWLRVVEDADPDGAHYVKSVLFASRIMAGEMFCWRRSPGETGP